MKTSAITFTPKLLCVSTVLAAAINSAALAQIGSASGFPDGFSFTISDSGSSVVNPGSLAVQLNGSPITLTSVNKIGGVTTAIYHGFPTLLPSGSTNTIAISCQDTNGNTISGSRTFVVPDYGTVPAAYAITGVNTNQPGFRILPWQSGGVEPNRIYWANEQLAGLHGTNNANLTLATNSGYIPYTNVINFNIRPASAGGVD